MQNENIPLLDCPKDFLLGDASGKLMNEYGRFPCKIKCGVFVYMAKGHARATLNITELDFHEHDTLYIEPGSFILIHEFSEDAKVCYLVLSSQFLERNTYGVRKVALPLPKSMAIWHPGKEVIPLIEQFITLMGNALNCTPPLLNSEMMVLNYNMMLHAFQSMMVKEEEPLAGTMTRKTEIYYDYCDMVMKHYQEWHHVAEYAEALRITVPHLCSTIKSVSNRTAGDIIVDAILMDAKAQLKITTVPIKEVAMNLGFDNVAFFNRFFKLHVGVTPKSYRNS